MTKLFSCLLLVLCCTRVWAEGAVPSNDPSLNAPVTLDVKGEALSDVLALLSKQTGVSLRATKEIADRKTTVYVDAMPLKDLMDGLATVHGYRWSVVKRDSGKVFEFWESQKARLIQEAAVAGAVGAAWRGFDAYVAETVRMSGGDPAAMEDELQRMYRRIAAEERPPTGDELAQMQSLARLTGYQGDMGRLYLSLQPDIMAVLRSGARAYFDTDTSETQWRVPPDMAGRIAAKLAKEEMFKGHTPGSYNIMLDCRASGGSIECRATIACYRKGQGPDGSDESNGASGAGLGPLMPIPEVEPPHALTKLPHSPDDGTLSREISFSASELAGEADLYGQTETSTPMYANRSDILSLLHRKTGVQVIADHFSGWLECKPDGWQTVMQILDGLPDRIDPKSRPDWGWDGRCLFLREHYPYEHDAMEFPNRLLRYWRTSLVEKRHWDLDALASLAGINDRQSRAWAQHAEWLFLARGVDYSGALIFPVDWCRQALGFYGSLRDSQRKTILASGIRTADLSMAQVEKLLRCFAMTKPDWNRLDPDTRRVGLYKDGLRIDKPEPDDQMPALVRIERRPGGDFLVEAQSRSSLHEGWKRIPAGSPQDAWAEALKIWPDLPTRPCFFGRDAGYVLVMLFQDGSQQEVPMPLFEPMAIPQVPAANP